MKIIFVCRSLKPFIKTDIDILSQKHHVSLVEFRRSFFHRLSLLIKIPASDMVFCWFAGRHTLWAFFLGKIFRKKCIVVAGGYDVVRMPEISYGSLLRWPTRLLVFAIFRLADKVFTFSKSSMQDIFENIGIESEKVALIPLGVPSPADLRIPQNKRDKLDRKTNCFQS